jgi:S-adenosylmethionine:tRNA ribosyltransferase-isomerase
MKLSDFHYELPESLIAQFPPERRGDSRLLCLNGNSGELTDEHFSSFIDKVNENDLLVFNNTRVMPARLFGQKQTGGRVEILIERLLDDFQVLAHVRSSKSPKPGSKLMLEGAHEVEVIDRQDALFVLQSSGQTFLSIMMDKGHMPLPPYITRQDGNDDQSRYQTVYAEKTGAVAAPTAGLHFTDEMLEKLNDKGVRSVFVTLHVGAGTFQPVRVDNLDEHQMHKEYVELDQVVVDAVQEIRNRGGRVIAIGTTSVRSLESAAITGTLQVYQGDTQLFIRPGFKFNVVDVMLTNFHLPESTLLMLVSAFAGYENIMQAYQHAVEQQYRFFSYGDAMWLEKRN